MPDRIRPRGRGRGGVPIPITRGDLEKGTAALVRQHANGQLSSTGLVDALVLLAEAYATDAASQRQQVLLLETRPPRGPRVLPDRGPGGRFMKAGGAAAAVLDELEQRAAHNAFLDAAHQARKATRNADQG